MRESADYYGGQDYDYYASRPGDLRSLDELGDWNIEEGEDLRGWNLEDQSGRNIGKIKDVLIDTTTGEAVFIAVEHGGVMGIGGKRKLIPLDQIRLDTPNQRAILLVTADHLETAPDYMAGTRDYDTYYDYWGGKRAISGTRATGEAYTGKMGQAGEQIIPEVEEHLEVGKRTEQVGEVEVRKEVETRPETVRETVGRTRIRVFRRGVEPGREVAAGEQVLREGESITIPVVEEKLVAEKKAEVTGEVVIQPETVHEEKEITHEVRKEHVKVEQHGEADLEEEESEELHHRPA